MEKEGLPCSLFLDFGTPVCLSLISKVGALNDLGLWVILPIPLTLHTVTSLYLDVSSELQTSCPLDISTWLFHIHMKINKSKTTPKPTPKSCSVFSPGFIKDTLLDSGA